MTKALCKTIVALVAAFVAVGSGAVFTAIGIDRVEKAHPPVGRYIQVHGGRLHLVQMDRSNTPTVVLLHGSGTNLEDMRLPLGQSLSAHYRVILIDRPGHGWSERPDGINDASPGQQARLLHEMLEKISVRRVILVGHSWSGAVALAYALTYPKDIMGLVLLAPLAYPQPPTVAWHWNAVTALLTQSARIAESPIIGPIFARTFVYPLGELLLQLAMRSAFAPQMPPRNYIDETGQELLLRPSEFISNSEDLAMIDGFLSAQAPNYGQILAPTIIITGDSDAVLSADVNARRLANEIPNASLIVLPGIGHMVQYVATAQVIKAISEIVIKND